MHFLQVQPVCAPIFLYRQVKETFFPNFSEIPSVLEMPPVPKVVLFGRYCDYYGVHHPVTRGKPILPPLIVLAPILIILTFPDANDRDLPSPNNNTNFPSLFNDGGAITVERLITLVYTTHEIRYQR